MLNQSQINSRQVNAPGDAPPYSVALSIPLQVDVHIAALALSVHPAASVYQPVSLSIVAEVGVHEGVVVLSIHPQVQVDPLVYGLSIRPRVRVYQPLSLSVPCEAWVAEAFSALSVPCAVSVYWPRALSVPAEVQVLDASLPVGAPREGQWNVTVAMDGADVSDRLTGTVTVDAEEGVARVAEFTLMPLPAAVNPFAWIGAAVRIRFAYAGAESWTLFSGVVETPDFDPATGLTTFRCTDDRQGRLNAMSQAEVDAVTPGAFYSRDVFQWAAGARYAEDRLSTLAQALDLSVERAWRLTPWQAVAVADYTFQSDDVLDGSVALETAARAGMRNTATITLDARYPRIKQRWASVRWDHPDSNITLLLRQTTDFPTRDMVEQAAAGTGWNLEELHITLLPESQTYMAAPGSWAQWEIGEQLRQTLVWAMSAALSKRYSQTATETWTASVEAPDSIAQLGNLRFEDRASVESSFDASAWENDPHAEPVLAVNHGGETAQDERDTAREEDAWTVLVERARTNILASHRATRARFTTLLAPSLDVIHTARLEHQRVTAQGKVARVQHTIDVDAGSALTVCDLALSLVQASGLVTPDAPDPPPLPAKPDANTAGAAALRLDGSTFVNDGAGIVPSVDVLATGYVGNSGALLDAGTPQITPEFRITAPEIPAADRDPLELTTTRTSIRVEIPQDELLTA